MAAVATVSDRQCVVAFHLAVLEAIRESSANGCEELAIIQCGPGDYRHVRAGQGVLVDRDAAIRTVCHIRAPEAS